MVSSEVTIVVQLLVVFLFLNEDCQVRFQDLNSYRLTERSVWVEIWFVTRIPSCLYILRVQSSIWVRLHRGFGLTKPVK